MIRRPAPSVSLAVLVLSAAAARADVDVEVRNGETVLGTIAPATETETIRFRVPAGAALTVKAKAAKKGPTLHLDVTGPAGFHAAADGRTAVIPSNLVPETGLYAVAVTSFDGTTSGDYSLTVTWKTPAGASTTVQLGADESASLAFVGDVGSTATLSVKKAKKSSATGALVELTGPDLATVPLTGTTSKQVLTLTGGHSFSFKNVGSVLGQLTASVKVKPPKPSKKKLTLTTKVIGPGGVDAAFATASIVGALGGTVTVPAIGAGEPGAGIAGSAVSVPAGSVGAPTTLFIATAPPFTAGGSAGAGPTVFFGPEGTQFAKGKPATVTIPYDAMYDASTDLFEIYTRDAKGKVTRVPPPYVFDHAAHTVSFPTSHFSSFRALVPDGGQGNAEIIAYANVTSVRDVCFAYEPGNNPDLAFFFIAEDGSKVVGALRLSQTSFQLNHEVWAGGGTLTADGTPRLQFKFDHNVVSVFSLPDETTYVATTTQVFKIDDAGLVSLVAGTGLSQYSGNGGQATQASFVEITSVIVADDGTVYIADRGAPSIRVIDPVSHVIDVFAGTGTPGIGVDGVALTSATLLSPWDMDFTTDGGLYVADESRVRHLTPPNALAPSGVNLTVAGDADGATGSSGDDGSPTQARFRRITGLSRALDIFDPTAVKLVVCDGGAHTVRLVDLKNDKVRLLAGQHDDPGYSGDFSEAPGRVDSPTGIIALPTQIVFADSGNDRVRTRFFANGYP